MMIKSIKDFKAKKKSERIIKDLTQINIQLDKFISNIKEYEHYVPMKNIIYAIIDEQVVINLHLRKHKKLLEEK